MSFFKPSQINNDVVCVLKKRENGEFFITYEPLTSPIQNDLTQFENILKVTTQVDAKALYESLIINPFLKIILNPRSSFCDNLWEPWQEDTSKERLDNIFNSPYTDKIKYLKMLILAFKLHHTYQKCKQDNSVLAYSHRMIGWRTFLYQLDENFAVSFISNFGYGNSTFFCIKLTYKEIDIVPLTFWVNYQFVKQQEMINCSQKYEPQNENWLKAMEYLTVACNMFRNNETNFVNTYILGQCRKLIEGLQKFATQNSFEFITSGYHFVLSKETIILNGDALIAFRAAKITGSLTFINYIKNFQHISDIKLIIQRIENLNLGMIPKLKIACERLQPLLDIKQQRLVGFKILHNELCDENDAFKKEKQNIQQEFYQKKIFSSELINQGFITRFPLYKIFEKKFIKNSEEYDELSSIVYQTKDYIDQYNNSLKIIEEYFSSSKNQI